MTKTIFLAAALSTFAHAGIIAVLDNASLSGSPGDTLPFTVTLTNTSATDQVWLNGIGSTASSPFLIIDVSPFNSGPLFIDPSTSTAPFELFDVMIDPSAAAGPYVGSFVSILGGADGGAETALDDLVDVSFDVTVQSSTPEPAAIILIASGLLAMTLAGLRQRRQTVRRA